MIRQWCVSLVLWIDGIGRWFSHRHPQRANAYKYWEYQSPQIPSGLRLETNDFEIGVGVYRGEAVAFRRVIDELSHSERWVVHKLRYRNLHHIHTGVAMQLLCLAHQLEGGIQSFPSLQDSQMSHAVILGTCPLTNQLGESPSLSSLERCDSGDTLIQRAQEQAQIQGHPKLQQCPYLNSIKGEGCS